MRADDNYDWDGPKGDDHEHIQPQGFTEEDSWTFNSECACEDCLNFHTEMNEPVDGCDCDNCQKLDAHTEPSGSPRWPWHFNPSCDCVRCMEFTEDEPDSGYLDPWGSNPSG